MSLAAALVVNCSQFAACSSKAPLTDSTFSGDTAHWIKALTVQRPDLLVRDLIAPGTHDSASFTIPPTKVFSAVGRTQRLSVHEQLPGRWLNSQLVLAPGVDGAADVWKAMIGRNSLQPIVGARKLYKAGELDSYLLKNADEPWNLLMLDYIDLCPAIVHLAIAFNFPCTLSISLATVCTSKDFDGSTDVTAKILTLVKRERVLLLTNIGRDLGLNLGSGLLTIAYQLGDVHHVLSFDFSPSSQLILSYFSRNQDALVLEVPGPGAGFICRDQICPRKTDDLRGYAETVLEYTYGDDGKCEFSVAL